MSSERLPTYRLHKPSGRAVVALDGHDFYLGRHGSPTSLAEYDRLIGEWLANGRCLPPQRSPPALQFLPRHHPPPPESAPGGYDVWGASQFEARAGLNEAR